MSLRTSSTTLFREYDQRVVEAIQNFEMTLFDGTWDFGVKVDYLDIDYSRYGDLDEYEIVRREKRRIRRLYNKLLPGKKIEVNYDDWWGQICVFWETGLGDQMIEDTRRAMNFIYQHHLWVSNEPELLRQVIVDDSIPEKLPLIESPSGRADIITHLSMNKNWQAIPEFREIVLHDYSLMCRLEAIRGLYRLGADPSIFLEAARDLPPGDSKDHQTYRQAVLVLAAARGVEGLEDYLSYESEVFEGTIEAQLLKRIDSGEKRSIHTGLDDDIEF
jgi:hypothetical protein